MRDASTKQGLTREVRDSMEETLASRYLQDLNQTPGERELSLLLESAWAGNPRGMARREFDAASVLDPFPLAHPTQFH